MTSTRTARYVTLLSVVLALALTAAVAACGSDEPSGVTGPDRTASPPTETPGSGDAPTATDAPAPGSPATDREILVTVYNALDGPNWEDSGKLAERRAVGRMVWSHDRRQRPRDLVADRGVRVWTGVERGDSL